MASTFAKHLERPILFVRVTPLVGRFAAMFGVGARTEGAWGEWLVFAHRANEIGVMVPFSVSTDDDASFGLRASALGPLTYERTSFGVFLGTCTATSN